MSKQMLEIRGMDSRELRTKLADLRKEEFGLRFHGASEAEAKPSRHKQIRAEIARLLTVLGERDNAAKPAAGANKS